MHAIKGFVKRNLPDPAMSYLQESYDFTRRIPDWPSATFHQWRRDSVKRIKEFKGLHKGERCFLIGNGPSLRKTDLSKLSGEYTIGVNKFFLAFPTLGFQTSYYLVVNDLIAEQSGSEIEALTMPVFVSWRMRRWLKPKPNLMFLYTTYTGRAFARNIANRVWEGGTVTYVGLQLALYLGFEQVVLIGVDHNYTAQGTPNETITSQSDDTNHFHPEYFGKGYRWQLPDLDNWVKSYQMAKANYEKAGCQVIDATVGGKLQVFPKVDYDSLF